ncbi:hypothetical protein D3C71_2079850 [compost metagenome]
MTEHQHAGDGDHRRVTEAGESPLRRHQAEQHAGQQGRHGHQVMPPAPPEEQGQGGQQHRDNRNLRTRHNAASHRGATCADCHEP